VKAVRIKPQTAKKGYSVKVYKHERNFENLRHATSYANELNKEFSLKLVSLNFYFAELLRHSRKIWILDRVDPKLKNSIDLIEYELDVSAKPNAWFSVKALISASDMIIDIFNSYQKVYQSCNHVTESQEIKSFLCNLEAIRNDLQAYLDEDHHLAMLNHFEAKNRPN